MLVEPHGEAKCDPLGHRLGQPALYRFVRQVEGEVLRVEDVEAVNQAVGTLGKFGGRVVAAQQRPAGVRHQPNARGLGEIENAL